MTFSIVARSDAEPDGRPAWGVAVASKFLAVGNAVPAAVGIDATARYPRVGIRRRLMMYPDKVGLPRAGAVAVR